MRGAAMSLTAATTGFVIFLFTVPVVQGKDDGWKVTYPQLDVCALKGSTVEINCTFEYPPTVKRVEDKFWFTKESNNVYNNLREDPEYSGHVHYICGNNNNCTLRITDLRKGDTAVYKFRFITDQRDGKYSGLPGVTLSVTDLQVQVSRSPNDESSTRTELTCHSSCVLPGNPNYIWYKNEGEIQRQTSQVYSGSFNPADSYSCAVNGNENSRSPSVYAPRVPSVSVSPSGEIEEDSSVTLNCSSDANPAATYSWYKRNGNPNLQLVHNGPKFVFSPIQSSDSGEYYCKAVNDLGEKTSEDISIDVKYGPRLPSVSVSPSGEIVEGSSVTLNCSSDANPAATYTWFNGTHKLAQRSDGIYNFTAISSEDRGTYYCMAENQHGHKNSSSLLLNVQYAPKLLNVSVSPSGEIVEGTSVTLTCSSDANPAASYTWYKENQKLPQGQNRTYYFHSVSSEDSGKYFCKSENQYGGVSSSLLVDVQYAPKLPSVSMSPSGQIMESSSVTLTCSSDANPEANYTWYKENEDSLRASEQNFTITDIRAEHSGNYYCVAQNIRGHQNSTLHVIVVAGVWKSAVIGTAPAVFLAIIWLSIFLLIRKKRAAKQSSEPGDRPDNREECLLNQLEEQEDLHYATIHFSNNETDPVYCNITAAGHRRREKEEEEEEVEYTTVKFNSDSTAPRTRGPETEDESAALYSTVHKTVGYNRNL